MKEKNSFLVIDVMLNRYMFLQIKHLYNDRKKADNLINMSNLGL